jgi:non-specific serine/threonine protein kinase
MDRLLAYDAVRLFVERARLQRPELAPSPPEVATIAAICRALDGLPLAIELAAARAGALSVGQIAARLQDCFGLLSRSARTALPRHQTLAATMDWSYGLLTAPERALLRALSVFAGGFTLEAAEAVCGDVGVPFAGPDSQVDVLDLLASLVDKSLVVLGDREGEPRYRLLETVRQYAREKLDAADDGEHESVRRRHAAYFLALAEAAEPQLREGPEQLVWFARLETEHDNLRAALDWAAEQDATTGLRLAGALAWFWYIRGYFGEGRRWLERFLNAGADGPPSVRAKALHGAVTIATMLADGLAVRSFSEQALALRRELGDWLEYARTLHNLGQWTFRWEGDLDTGRALLEEALAITRRCEEAGRERTIAYCLSNLGFAIHLLGDDSAARGLLEEAVALQRQRADKDGLAMALSGLARVSRAEGDTARARAQQAEALTLRRELHGPWGVAWPLSGIAELAVDDRPELTARLLGVLEVMNELRGDIVVHERIDREAMTEAARRALGEAAFAKEWAAGRSLPLAQAVAEALAYATTPPGAPSARRARTADVDLHGLTERELEVLRLVAAGKSNKEIADVLVISQNTVLRHVTHILRKTGAANRTEAAVYAQRHSLTG